MALGSFRLDSPDEKCSLIKHTVHDVPFLCQLVVMILMEKSAPNCSAGKVVRNALVKFKIMLERRYPKLDDIRKTHETAMMITVTENILPTHSLISNQSY